jgi:inositol hexakisphosphate/diphosphoinositol-pentakisphosphate kinase
MYLDGQNAGSGCSDAGFIRSYSTFLNDFKIYASDEGRVKMTAAAFAKGLLALDGELPPILVQMVHSTNTNCFLDNNVDSSGEKQKVKKALHDRLAKDRPFTEEDYDIVRERKLMLTLILLI